MGLLDSIFKTTVKKIVNEVLDTAVDSVLNSDSKPSEPQQPVRIVRPNIAGEPAAKGFYTYQDDKERNYFFEKADGLYETNPGAAEIDVAYYCANSEEEAYEDDLKKTPMLYIGLDEVSPNSRRINRAVNVRRTPVAGNAYITEKVSFDEHSELFGARHCICYRFYPVPDLRGADSTRELVVDFPANCDAQLKSKAVEAFELIAATLKID